MGGRGEVECARKVAQRREVQCGAGESSHAGDVQGHEMGELWKGQGSVHFESEVAAQERAQGLAREVVAKAFGELVVGPDDMYCVQRVLGCPANNPNGALYVLGRRVGVYWIDRDVHDNGADGRGKFGMSLQ